MAASVMFYHVFLKSALFLTAKRDGKFLSSLGPSSGGVRMKRRLKPKSPPSVRSGWFRSTHHLSSSSFPWQCRHHQPTRLKAKVCTHVDSSQKMCMKIHFTCASLRPDLQRGAAPSSANLKSHGQEYQLAWRDCCRHTQLKQNFPPPTERNLWESSKPPQRALMLESNNGGHVWHRKQI